jgi:hypothetical protein
MVLKHENETNKRQQRKCDEYKVFYWIHHTGNEEENIWMEEDDKMQMSEGFSYTAT